MNTEETFLIRPSESRWKNSFDLLDSLRARGFIKSAVHIQRLLALVMNKVNEERGYFLYVVSESHPNTPLATAAISEEEGPVTIDGETKAVNKLVIHFYVENPYVVDGNYHLLEKLFEWIMAYANQRNCAKVFVPIIQNDNVRGRHVFSNQAYLTTRDDDLIRNVAWCEIPIGKFNVFYRNLVGGLYLPSPSGSS